jgi:hypothetical protein
MGRVLALIVFAALASCGRVDSTIVPPNTADIAGTYTLRTYDGLPLPAITESSAAGTNTLLNETYTLTAASRFTSLYRARRQQTGTDFIAEVGDTGTFTRSGVLIQLNGLGQTITFGEIKGDTLRLTVPGKVRVYTK